jgi:glycosyltransferase involved in cell wall biosynthesis
MYNDRMAATKRELLISVVVPVYNGAEKLRASLDSVVGQEAVEFEVVIVDGGSTDDTVAVARAYADRNVRCLSEPDRGVYDAMNKGIALARGRYVYFLGAGDLLRPDALRHIAEHLTDRPGLIYGDACDVQSRAMLSGAFSNWRLSRGNICHQAIFYHRAVFDLVGLYDLRYPVVADWVLNMRCFHDARIEKRHVDLVVADFEGGGLSDTQPDEAFQRDRLDLIRRYLGPVPYVLNAAVALVPRSLKEARYRAWGRIRKSR